MAWKNSHFMIFRGSIEELRAFAVAKGHKTPISIFSSPNVPGVLHWCRTEDPDKHSRAAIMGFSWQADLVPGFKPKLVKG